MSAEPAQQRAQRLLRLFMLPLSAALICALIVFGARLRSAEATSLRWWLTPWMRTLSSGDTLVVGTDSVRPLALHITPECTAAIMAIPCVIAFAIFTVMRNVRIGRALGALVGVTALVFAVNQVRIALLATAYLGWGERSLWLAHSVIGTLISLSGIVVALIVQTRVTADESHGARE